MEKISVVVMVLGCLGGNLHAMNEGALAAAAAPEASSAPFKRCERPAECRSGDENAPEREHGKQERRIAQRAAVRAAAAGAGAGRSIDPPRSGDRRRAKKKLEAQAAAARAVADQKASLQQLRALLPPQLPQLPLPLLPCEQVPSSSDALESVCDRFFRAITDDNLQRVEEILLENSANVNARDAQGNTPLHFAAQRDRYDVAQLLLQHGATPNVRNRFKETPLSLTLRNPSKITDLLLMKGAEVEEDSRLVVYQRLNLETALGRRKNKDRVDRP